MSNGGERAAAPRGWRKTSWTAAGEARSIASGSALGFVIFGGVVTAFLLIAFLIDLVQSGRAAFHDVGDFLIGWVITLAAIVVLCLCTGVGVFISARRSHRRLRRAPLVYPVAVAVSPDGEPFVVDAGRDGVVIFRPSGALDPIGGPASTIAVSLSSPRGLAFDRDGNLLIADTFGHRVVKVLPGGKTEVVAGAERRDGDGRGSVKAGAKATSGPLDLPFALAVDPQGTLYVTELGHDSIRRIRGEIIEDLAGTGQRGVSGDGGPAVEAALCSPRGVAVDTAGNVFFAERFSHRIRRIAPEGTITTVAGTGHRGASPSGSRAREAALAEPTAVAVDGHGRVFFCDTGNHRVCKIESNGELIIVAGNGRPGRSGDQGPAVKAMLDSPTGIAVDSAGTIYVTDAGNRTVRMISANRVIDTVLAIPRSPQDKAEPEERASAQQQHS